MTTSMTQLLNGLRAAAESTRLRLLAICSEGELTVSEITQVIGQSQPRVSRHLKQLCDAGLLHRFPEQNWVVYRVPPRGLAAELVHSLLDLLPEDDETLLMDHQRVEAVKAERAQVASDYVRLHADKWQWINQLKLDEEELKAAILDELGPDGIGELLDIGTGTGRMLTLLADKALYAVGIDISRDMLQVARSNLHAAGLNKCIVRQGNMHQLPFANEAFQTIIIDQALYLSSDPDIAIREAFHKLKPGGKLLVIDFLPYEIKDESPSEKAQAAESFQIGIDPESLCDRFSSIGAEKVTLRSFACHPVTVVLLTASCPANAATCHQ